VHGSGRVVDDLELALGKVDAEKGRLKLDRHLRSVSNQLVFAAGDAAAQGPALTPIATLDADCVARNLLEGCVHEPDYSGSASVVFAPSLAMAGLVALSAPIFLGQMRMR
jgi:glutathione reductase (NADPH)